VEDITAYCFTKILYCSSRTLTLQCRTQCHADVSFVCISQVIGSLQQLTFFDASKNNIETIALEIENCVSLTDIHLSTNQLLYLPESIGFYDVIDFCK